MNNHNAPHMENSPIQQGSREDTIFSAMSDLGFTRFVTPKLLRILFILGIVVIILWSLLPAVAVLVAGDFMDSSYSSSSYSYGSSSSYGSSDDGSVAGPVVFQLISGLINGFIQICLLRVGLETLHAFVKTAQVWQRIQNRVDAGTATL